MRATVLFVNALKGLKKVLNPLFFVVKKPFLWMGRGLFKILSWIYRLYLPLSRKLRLNRVFNQQRIVSVFTSKYMVHGVVVVLTFLVTASNIQAKEREVRADDYGRDSILYTLVRSDDDLIEETAVRYDTGGTPVITKPTSVMNNLGSVAYNQPNTVVIDDDFNTVQGASLGTTHLATTEESQKTPEQPFEHTVQGGETISTIAAKYGISTNTILWENDLAENSYIRPGQKLTILPTSGVSHTIKSGDTILALAEKYDVDAEEIVSFNKLADSSDITIGEALIIPGGKIIVAPTPAPTTSTPSSRLATVAPVTRPVSADPAPQVQPDAQPTGGWMWPTNTRRISQYYGYYHTGIDVDGEFGDPIWAAKAGTVVYAGWRGGYGLCVEVDHGGGYKTRYAHFQKIYVQNGQQVSQGQTLGEEGSTGRSTGSHLHYEIMVNGRFQNPFSYY